MFLIKVKQQFGYFLLFALIWSTKSAWGPQALPSAIEGVKKTTKSEQLCEKYDRNNKK